ncbi:MAG: methyltransferase [Burkholderiaceae bacterium]
MNEHASAEKILQLGTAFWASKTLLSAVELKLFTQLANEPLDHGALAAKLGLGSRGTLDFFDALVALGMLEIHDGKYSNTPEAALFLDASKETYIGGILEMANDRLYPFWGHLTEALKTGQPQNEAKSGKNTFATLYADPARLKQFLQAMTGVSLGNAMALAQKFPWSNYQSFADIGCAQGAVPVAVAKLHPHLSTAGFDLPPVRPIFEEYVQTHGLTGQVRFIAGDFFNDPLPHVDVIVMGHILHDWDLDQKRMLLNKAYASLPKGGALIVYDAMIDNERKKNVFGLLMSLNMLIETMGGFDYTIAACEGWMRDAGFASTQHETLAGPHSMVVGIK